MRSSITGTTMPVLQLALDPGEVLLAETGQLAWMTPNVRLSTTMRTGGASGLWGALSRAVAGGGLFMTEFTAEGGPGGVAFAARLPGSINEVAIDAGRGYLVHRHGFLCATQGVALGVGFQRSLGRGIFGGEGFVLQRLTGQGTAWVELGGEVIGQELQAGETLLVHPGHVGMFAESVAFDIVTIGGIRNALFGGEGLFLVRLTGPGSVWLQTLTVPGLAHALSPYLPSAGKD